MKRKSCRKECCSEVAEGRLTAYRPLILLELAEGFVSSP